MAGAGEKSHQDIFFPVRTYWLVLMGKRRLLPTYLLKGTCAMCIKQPRYTDRLSGGLFEPPTFRLFPGEGRKRSEDTQTGYAYIKCICKECKAKASSYFMKSLGTWWHAVTIQPCKQIISINFHGGATGDRTDRRSKLRLMAKLS